MKYRTNDAPAPGGGGGAAPPAGVAGRGAAGGAAIESARGTDLILRDLNTGGDIFAAAVPARR